MELCDIKVVEATNDPARVRICADLIYDDDYPDEQLWFELDKGYAEQMSGSGDPWLACLLPVAATIGEPLRICRPVDPVLLQNARELLRIWDCWFDYTQVIDIEAHAESPGDYQPQHTGAFFSGGIDSFFTVLNADHPARGEPSYPIDDLIIVWGFDIPIDDADAFHGLLRSLQRSATDLGKNLIDISTNLRKTRFRQAHWGYVGHGGGLASIGLLLEKRFRRVLIASSPGYRQLLPWGTHPLTDPLYSTTHTQFIHHGSAYGRADKTAVVAGSDIALKHMHVCGRQLNDKNCCACIKCFRTMIALDLLGVLGRAPTFKKNTLDADEIKRVCSLAAWDVLYAQELIHLAKKKNRPEVIQAIEYSLKRSEKINRRLSLLKKTITRIFKLGGGNRMPSSIRRVVWWIDYQLREWILRDAIM